MTAQHSTAPDSVRAPANAELHVHLLRAQPQLMQSEKLAAIGQLAAGVAHEINNPIGYVFSNIGTLSTYVNDLLRLVHAYEEMECSSPEVTRMRSEMDIDFLVEDILSLIAESQEGIDRVKKIVHSLKDFSRADDGGPFVASDLLQCIESTLNVAGAELRYRATVRKEFVQLPMVECRPSQINQVLMNLLVNAAQSIKQQGEIVVRTALYEGGALIEISDTGAGIDPAHMDRLFDPFFTTKPIGMGTGLGLSLSYGILEDHGGWIKADSELGKGTRFSVWLPLKQDSTAISESRR